MSEKDSLDGLLTLIRAQLYRQQKEREELGSRAPSPPFITISRQAGAGGRTLARLLVERLNAAEPDSQPWAAWDRELVERVSRERNIPESLIESLESAGRSWFERLFSDVTDVRVYRGVIGTIRLLARAGRAIIVGRGGVYATEDLPAGVHVRLVAPLSSRVAHMSELLHVPEGRAASEVRRLERDRRAFYRRHWPGRRLIPELFTAVLNTAAVSESAQADCVVRLVRDAEARHNLFGPAIVGAPV